MKTTPDPARYAALRAEADRQLADGTLGPAIQAHAELLRAYPGDGDAWFNLGWLQQRARRFEAAVAAYRQALVHGAATPAEVHTTIAAVLAQALDRPADAQAELERALAIDPRHVGAWVNLGQLHEQHGKRDEARAAYRKAVEIAPGHALALARLAAISTVRELEDGLLDRLRAALAEPGRTDEEAADLGFALARALDEAGAWDEAFDACAQANRRGRAAQHVPPYDPALHEAWIDRIIAAFPERPAACPDDGEPGADGAGMVFICGMFRSGSTLVEQMLAAHPQVAAGGEIDLIPVAAHALFPPPPAPFTPPGIAALKQLRGQYLQRVAELRRRAPVVTDKRPDNFLHLGLIKQMFPRAKIVHTRRDPLDNCLSVWFLHLGPAMAYAYDLADCAHWYRQHERLMAHWQRLFGSDIVELDYDALVQEPKPRLQALLAALGLPWDEACLRFEQAPTVVRTPSAAQVRTPLYQHASGRWRHYAHRLQALQDALRLPAQGA
ncbi:MAG: sulfotransferase [Rubrivivax sp.]